MTKSKLFIVLIQAALFCLLFVGMQIRGASPAPLNVYISGTLQSFSYLDEHNELKGFNVDVMRAVCDRLDRDCRFVIKPFKEILSGTQNQDADIGVGNFLKTPEREALVDFTVPYWRSTSSYVGKGADTSAKTVCAITGTVQSSYLQKDVSIQVVDSSNQLEQLEKLLTNQCELALLPTLQALELLKSDKSQSIHYIGAPLSENGLGGDVYMILRKGDRVLQESINLALSDLIKDGSYESMMLKYFPFSIK